MDTPPDDLARTRFTILSALRAAGAVTMLIGMWLWFADGLGASDTAGIAVFLLGFVAALMVPPFLARRWRSPRA